MSSNRSSGSSVPLGADLVIPGLALCFTVYFYVSIADLAWEAKENREENRGQTTYSSLSYGKRGLSPVRPTENVVCPRFARFARFAGSPGSVVSGSDVQRA